MRSIAVEVEFVEKETEAVVGEEGVHDYEFFLWGGALAESYTKKANNEDIG